MRPWGPRGAGKAAWVWAGEVLTCIGCVLFAIFCTPKWLVWVCVDKGRSVALELSERCWPWIRGWWSRLDLVAWEDVRISRF